MRRLSDALTHTGPPPIDEELERFGSSEELAARARRRHASTSCPSSTPLEDAELTHLVRVLMAHEARTSARRQELHRELDKLRAEHVARLQERFAATGGE